MHVCVAWALGEGWTEGGRGILGRGSWGGQLGASCGRRTLDEMAAKHARRLALLEAAGGHEPSGALVWRKFPQYRQFIVKHRKIS